MFFETFRAACGAACEEACLPCAGLIRQWSQNMDYPGRRLAGVAVSTALMIGLVVYVSVHASTGDHGWNATGNETAFSPRP